MKMENEIKPKFNIGDEAWAIPYLPLRIPIKVIVVCVGISSDNKKIYYEYIPSDKKIKCKNIFDLGWWGHTKEKDFGTTMQLYLTKKEALDTIKKQWEDFYEELIGE